MVGVDLGGTKIRTVVATAEGEIVAGDQRPTAAAGGPEAVIERVVGSVEAALRRAGASLEQIVGIGVGAPGPVDVRRGAVVMAPNLPGWRDVPLREALRQRLGVAVHLANDASVAALGEHRFGAGRGSQHMVYITVGTGIGGGLIIDGALYEGAAGGAGEVGHMVLEPQGPPCGCGARGCLEALAAGPAIARQAESALGGAAGRPSLLRGLAGGLLGGVTAEMVVQAARQGDALSLEVLATAARYLGLGITNVVHLCNPELVVVGGSVAKAGELLLGPARRVLRQRGLPLLAEAVRVLPGELGDDAGTLGAVALVLRARQM